MSVSSYPKNGETFYKVVVSKRLSGKLKTLKKSGISSKAEANRLDQDFTDQLAQLSKFHKNQIYFWISLVENYGEVLARKTKFSTTQGRLLTLKAHTRHWFNVPIQEITADQVKALLEECELKMKASSVINLRKGLNGVFQLAIDRGYISRNPLNLFPPPKKDKASRLEAMTPSEVRKLIREGYARDVVWAPIWHVVYLTGLRSGEAFALKVSDVDFESGRLYINKAYCSKSRTIGATKTGESRTIPLSKELRGVLGNLCAGKQSDTPLLPLLNAWRKGDAAKALRAFQRELGIRETNFHSLRSSFITHLLLNNVPMIKVQALVGHREIKTTMFYVRLVSQDLVGCTDVLSTDPAVPSIGRSEQDTLGNSPTENQIFDRLQLFRSESLQ